MRAVCVAICFTFVTAVGGPRGYNTWDSYAGALNESVVLAVAASLAADYVPFGYDTLTIDGGWNSNVTTGEPVMDAYGRPAPDPKRFPSSEGGRGLRPLSDTLAALGLKLGAWIIRGVPVAALLADLPIADSIYHVRDAVRLDKNCTWDSQIVGTNAPSAAATAWYESLARAYVQQGISFVKADCMWPGSPGGMPFDEDVIAFSEAFARLAPGVKISWSPGNGMSVGNGSFVAAHGGAWGVMYRITADFHESWPALKSHLATAELFAPLVGANGTFPDPDMLSLGRQAPDGHPTAFTQAEQRLLVSLWVIMRAPLIIGARLPLDAGDSWTHSLLTNAAVLAVQNGTHGNAPSAPVLPPGQDGTDLHAWTATFDGAAGRTAVALFNARDEAATLGVVVPGGGCAVDLWTGANEGALPPGGLLSRTLPPHSGGLWAVAAKCADVDELPGVAALRAATM